MQARIRQEPKTDNKRLKRHYASEQPRSRASTSQELKGYYAGRNDKRSSNNTNIWARNETETDVKAVFKNYAIQSKELCPEVNICCNSKSISPNKKQYALFQTT